MTISLSDYIKDSVGHVINNGQCWGLAQDYINKVLGAGSLSTQGGTHPGYAIGSFTGYENNGLSQWFTKIPSGGNAPAGSLVFWNWGTQFPDFSAPESHVAVLLSENQNSVQVLSQNSGGNGATQVQTLPKEGIAGYLVPKNSISTDSASINPISNVNTAQNANWLTDSVFGGFMSAIGLGDLMKPDSSFATGFQSFLTNVFLPETYVRILAAWIGFFLIVGGIVFIILDYHKSGESK